MLNLVLTLNSCLININQLSFTDVESQNSRDETDSSDEDLIDEDDSFSLIDNNIKTNKTSIY